MRFTKIKANDEGVQLEYETKKEGSTESVKYDSSDAPLETFVGAPVAEGDGWTQETPPPKAADVSSVGQ